MAVTNTRTVREICTRALRLAGVTPVGESAEAEDMDEAVETLNDMLKGWQGRAWGVWTVASQSLTLTTAASYTLDPVRPLAVLNANLKRDGIETPMTRMTRDEYDEIPDKDSTGLPTTYYYDRQRESALFYVWPVLSTADGETVEITYTREQEDIASPNDVVDVPGEVWEPVVYMLASRLMDVYGVSDKPLVAQRAEALRIEAEAFDREGSVYFMPEMW